jgi:hypothetical protein
MKRGLGPVAILAAAVVIAGAIAANDLGPAVPATSAGSARSGDWMCPHGGGEDWTAYLSLSNPGATTVEARVTSLGDRRPSEPQDVSVSPGAEVVLEVPATEPGDATSVEYFGGWIGAGWVVKAPDPVPGLGAEPCLAASSDTWYTTDSSTQRGTKAWLVVMNPHASLAVFNIVLFAPSTPPVRRRELTDVVLKGRRSVAFRVDPKVLGEDVVGAQLDAKVGRVAVATLTLSEEGGVRSTVGMPALAGSWVDLTAAGSGQSTLVTLLPGDEDLTFTSIVRTADQPEPGDPAASTQLRRSTLASPVTTNGPTTVVANAEGDSTFLAALRSEGRTGDDAATAGTSAPAPAWVVPPTLTTLPATPLVVVANPGAADTVVDLSLLRIDGTTGASTSLEIPAGSVAAAPASFLEDAPRSAVLVTADVPVVALGASTSGGKDGMDLYGLATGVAVPGWALAG